MNDPEPLLLSIRQQLAAQDARWAALRAELDAIGDAEVELPESLLAALFEFERAAAEERPETFSFHAIRA